MVKIYGIEKEEAIPVPRLEICALRFEMEKWEMDDGRLRLQGSEFKLHDSEFLNF
ncbi:MAG: hypothetical protein KGJ59_03855 [Bacteroidota bacterium]|nr:hypothetical protein [Bacteroidota bacterium]